VRGLAEASNESLFKIMRDLSMQNDPVTTTEATSEQNPARKPWYRRKGSFVFLIASVAKSHSARLISSRLEMSSAGGRELQM
jgi:hypothetical protein